MKLDSMRNPTEVPSHLCNPTLFKYTDTVVPGSQSETAEHFHPSGFDYRRSDVKTKHTSHAYVMTQ